ncbi:response regulator [Ammoniphilus sp. CFH 90114]|uniref:response regulator n=1 Tax=Ammoniphilus sp. CFH 90114 TaxID=2493665 RepID=UPI00100F81CA|nr:response regulator [Ammoniphilus sp. CFH 90114]RXT04384.1 response regulator transcription factor [Ammoniphilus sp. CFH 90114]
MRVLIVDDAMFMRVTLKQMLLNGGYEVVGEASSGIEAINQYKLLSPDVVLMDIFMPELDGISALKEIKQYNEKAKIIICSAVSHRKSVIEAIQAGAIDFLAKPIHQETLILSIEKAQHQGLMQTERGIQIS